MALLATSASCARDPRDPSAGELRSMIAMRRSMRSAIVDLVGEAHTEISLVREKPARQRRPSAADAGAIARRWAIRSGRPRQGSIS